MTAEPLRKAVAAGDYAGAAILFQEYARTLSPDEASLAELAELIRWTRTAVLCARAHLETETQSARDSLNVVAAYSR